MKKYEALLQSVTPLGQGRYHDSEKLPREGHDDYEKRTYLEKLHTSVGKVYIPPMAFKKCLEDTARYLKMQIPGRGKETYTKNFVQGVIFNEPLLLDLKPDETRLEKVFTLAQPGKSQGGRVWKYFPVIDAWAGVVPFFVIDEILTYDVIQKHFELAGMITGLGVWRPQRGGMWGKFKLVELHERAIV